MRVYLDDVRDCPVGWVLARTPEEFRVLVQDTWPDEVSLDHDLGDGVESGYDVLCWLQQRCLELGLSLPVVRVHSANPVGRARMMLALASWDRMRELYGSVVGD